VGQALRIMSANLWNGRADPEAFADLVLAQAVDVVAVQEISPEQAEALSAVMPYGELQPGRKHDGMGIAMQRPAEMSRVPMAHRDARVAHLDPAHWPEVGRRLEVVNVHLMAPQMFRPEPAFRVRPKQVRSLVEHLQTRPEDQRVVLGDFNATPLWPAYRRIAAQLTDAAVVAAEKLGRPAAATWGPGQGSPGLVRIDHGFIGDAVRVEDFRVVSVPDSDHCAIVMDVSAAGGVTAAGADSELGRGDSAGAERRR